MKWVNKLERKYGRYAIKNLMYYIVVINAVVFILMMIDPTAIFYKLALFPSLVLRGEIWRLVSYIFIPPTTMSPIFIIFVLYFYYMVGMGLEQEWGSFKFNIYYLVGMLGTTLAAFITGGGGTAVYLNMSLFLAFAYIYPDFEIRLFLLLPLKVKYLAYVYWFFIAVTLFTSPIPSKVAALVSIGNYFLFFGKDFYKDIRRRRQVQQNRKKFFTEYNKKKK